MKTIYPVISAALLILLFNCRPLMGNKPADNPDLEVRPPVLIDKSVNLYEAGDFFLAGQPEKGTYDTLYSLGLKMVINIRTEEEMEIHALEAYDEKDYVREIGLDYIQVPIGGPAGFTPEAIAEIDKALKKTRGRVLIHCRTAGRATLAWMAWLIQYHDHSIDQAVDLGKNAHFSFPLEDLLGYPVTMKKAGQEKVHDH
ncbi:MAG: hypothetical protein KFF73_09565 [Cyclobacteriaceae bacterium]|nr:hypothetical protein [Cyclobacteriaceae bacterium]